ncbi:hypothetical protein L484_019371 [Morus notabilis]|uniref:Glabrous enhancer-binding protein-like DBD domain-containing protein n=1 Tax=Morus notabilis TaxID=981085 RepID=W9RZW6_9ROSA|nr:hypothetical protein L484_019371 [Morus notabilis]
MRPLYHEDPPADSSSSEGEVASSEETSGSEHEEHEMNMKSKEESPPKAKKGSHSNAENGGSEEEKPEPKKSEGDDSKKVLFQRVWSEDDETAILKGMIDFTAKRSADPAVADMNEFHDFIKKSLQIGASKTRLSDKVRRLKKSSRKKINPTKPHEMAAFQLSKRIWGSGEPNSKGAAKSGQKVKSEALSSAVALAGIEMAEIDRKAGASASLSWPEYRVKHGLDLILESKKAEGEAKWEKLCLAELDLFVEKSIDQV